MPISPQRVAAAILASLLALPPCSLAFETPLSDTAIREAYFLGQHHDSIYGEFLQRYGVALPLPKNGPQIASVSFFTPYALTAIYSNQIAGSYSAQQAQIEHDKRPEFVHVVVQIWFTSSYGAYIVQPTNSRRDSVKGFVPRSPGFWRDFRVRVFQKDQLVIPLSAAGEPILSCGDESSCELSGATLTFEYPATAFTADTATVVVTPPEGDPVSVDFDLTSLR